MWCYIILLALTVFAFYRIKVKNTAVFLDDNTVFAAYKLPKICICLLAVYVFLRTFSYDTGADYLMYFNYYKNVTRGVIDIWGEGRDPAYRFIVSVLSHITDSPQIFFFLCSLLSSVSLVLVGKQYGKALPWIYLGWFVFMFNLSMNLYRQYISMSLIMFALFFWNSRYKKKYYYILTILVLAFLFHKSAIIGIFIIVLIYFLARYDISKWYFILLIVSFNIVANTLFVNLLSSYGFYLNSYMDMFDATYYADDILDSYFGHSTMGYANMTTAVVIVWFSDKVMKNNYNLRWMYYILAISFILEPITRQEILMRVHLYLVNFMVIGYGICIYENISKYPQKSNLILLASVFLQISYYYIYSIMNLFDNFPLLLRYE